MPVRLSGSDSPVACSGLAGEERQARRGFRVGRQAAERGQVQAGRIRSRADWPGAASTALGPEPGLAR